MQYSCFDCCSSLNTLMVNDKTHCELVSGMLDSICDYLEANNQARGK